LSVLRRDIPWITNGVALRIQCNNLLTLHKNAYRNRKNNIRNYVLSLGVTNMGGSFVGSPE
jgi:hypothetical protein